VLVLATSKYWIRNRVSEHAVMLIPNSSTRPFLFHPLRSFDFFLNFSGLSSSWQQAFVMGIAEHTVQDHIR
jgi:hypothetical protein